MSYRAWAYIFATLIAAGALCAAVILSSGPAALPWNWLDLLVFVLLATSAQLVKALAPQYQSYHLGMVFFFAGLLVMPFPFFVLLVLLPHLVEWAKERWTKSARLVDWYIQPFNISTHLLCGLGAFWIYSAGGISPQQLHRPVSLFVVTVAAIAYVLINHVLIGMALVLARGVPLKQSGILDGENLSSDLIMVLLGYVVAVLWHLSPLLIMPALSPLVLMYRALKVPMLAHAAHTDPKTGLWNARYFTGVLNTELERARRFGRPLVLMMADLDYMRTINNTYGHLAGDTVLLGIGEIIRNNIRSYDVAARFGGEEFSIVMLEAQLGEAQVLAERLRAEVEAAEFSASSQEQPIKATISIGIACFPEDGLNETDLVHAADMALYEAKHNGRNRVVCAVDLPDLHPRPPGAQPPSDTPPQNHDASDAHENVLQASAVNK